MAPQNSTLIHENAESTSELSRFIPISPLLNDDENAESTRNTGLRNSGGCQTKKSIYCRAISRTPKEVKKKEENLNFFFVILNYYSFFCCCWFLVRGWYFFVFIKRTLR